jgi:hypothetical protein
MKKVVFITILGLLVMLCARCGDADKEKTDRKRVQPGAEISIVNGKEIVINPPQPLYGETKLDLTEELSIGNSNDPRLFFNNISDIAADKNGNIYILDLGNHRLQIFDPNGNYRNTIGQPGQGPQDFYNPNQIEIGPDGHIYILDTSRRIREFDEKLELSNITKMKGDYQVMAIDLKGNFIMAYTDYFSQKNTLITKKLAKVNREGEVVKVYPLEARHPGKFIDGDTQVFFGNPHIDANVVHCVSPNGFLYCGINTIYKILVYDAGDTVIREIIVPQKPSRITGKEKDELARGIKGNRPLSRQKKIRELLPDFRPFFYAFRVDSIDNKDRLYVFQKHSIDDSKPYTVDIFDARGQYLYRSTVKFLPSVIHKNKFYIITRNEEDDMVIKRFKLNTLLQN